MKAILDSPMLYHTFQRAIGGFSARVKAINEYLSLKQGQVVVDIGCGPGHIAAHLPRGVDYHGFDIEPQYIEYAKRHFGGVAAFHCRMFDADAARTLGLADVVMMNGVLHHMDDSTVHSAGAQTRRHLSCPRRRLHARSDKARKVAPGQRPGAVRSCGERVQGSAFSLHSP